jgi:hypothetical protein
MHRKKEAARNALELKKTGGGPASLTYNCSFDFDDTQIRGLDNIFDSDNAGTQYTKLLLKIFKNCPHQSIRTKKSNHPQLDRI